MRRPYAHFSIRGGRVNVPLIVAVLTSLPLHALPLAAQARPDLSGIWRLLPEESRMIGGGGPPSDGYQLTWLVDHRDPEISVVVNVRNGDDTVEFAFRCTTDGRECVNELPLLQEVRRMSATWDGEDLVMNQQVSSQGGGFEALDRVSLTDSGQRLVFERTVTNDAGERPVRQVFRLLGPHPSQRPTSTACSATTSGTGGRATPRPSSRSSQEMDSWPGTAVGSAGATR
jgi:hypothetical protein